MAQSATVVPLLKAFQKMETVEHLAHVSLVAHQLGTPLALKREQIEKLRDAKAKYLQNAQTTVD